MNLTACDECGVVVDKDKLKFPTDFEGYDGDVATTKAAWDSRRSEYRAFVTCPVCKKPILQ